MYLALGERLAAASSGHPGRPARPRLQCAQGAARAVRRPIRRPCCATCSTGSASIAHIMVGHSWGGTLALTFALDFPQRAAGLVLIAAPTHPGFSAISWLNAALAGPLGWLFARTLALPFGVALIWPGFAHGFPAADDARDIQAHRGDAGAAAGNADGQLGRCRRSRSVSRARKPGVTPRSPCRPSRSPAMPIRSRRPRAMPRNLPPPRRS